MPIFPTFDELNKKPEQSITQIRIQLDDTCRQIELWFCRVRQPFGVGASDPDQTAARRIHMHASGWHLILDPNDQTCGFFSRLLVASPLKIHGQYSFGFVEPSDTQAESESDSGVRRRG